jgi:protein-S-isoprenylcysteine O-methyltransferase Ste14
MLKKFDIAPVWMGVALLVVIAFRPAGASPGLLALLAGTALLAAGGGLVFLAFREFERHGTDGTPGAVPRVLVTTGPFRYTRNPIYLAGVLIVAGLSLVLGSPIGLIVAPALGIVLQDRFIKPEEARIAATFGDEWAAFAARTRRWI